MATRKQTGRSVDDSGALRDEWLKVLADLTTKVKNWAEELNWSTREIAKKMKDSRLGVYEAPASLMQKRDHPRPPRSGRGLLLAPTALSTSISCQPTTTLLASTSWMANGNCTTCSPAHPPSRQSPGQTVLAFQGSDRSGPETR